MSELTFKYGAMNSGKSDVLIKTAFNYTERDLAIATIKPELDTKGESFITSRGGYSRRVDILATPEMDLQKQVRIFIARQALKKLHCVLVDESQFLTTPQIDQLHDITKQDNISVVAFGLRTDFRQQLFEGSKRLFEVADSFEKLVTMCRCGEQAKFNCRKVGNTYVFEGAQVAIDGESVEYDSLCSNCYANEAEKASA